MFLPSQGGRACCVVADRVANAFEEHFGLSSMKSETTEAFTRGVDFSQECLAPRGCQVGSAGRATTTSYGSARGTPTNSGKIPNMEKCTAVHCEGERTIQILQKNENKVTWNSHNCWSVSGNFIDRHDIQQRVRHNVPKKKKKHVPSRAHILLSGEEIRHWT